MAKLTPEEIERQVEEIAFRCKYEGYIASKKWAAKRRAKMIDADYTCERCGYNRNTNPIDIPLDVHHLTYEHLGDEPLKDLIVLCRTCHTKEHGRQF